IRFPGRYNQAREFCQEPGRLSRIAEVLQRLTGQACQLRVEALSGDQAGGSPNAADDPASQPSRYRRQGAEAEQEPLLRRAIEVLGAQRVRMDEGFGAAPAPGVERAGNDESEE